LADRRAFLRYLAPVSSKRWVVYAKPPFAGPEAVLAYLARYTHRVAISNQRLLTVGPAGVTFRYKDYRRDGADRQQVMTLAADEFIRRFLLHLLPCGFHRTRHYGLLNASARTASARALLAVAPPPDEDELKDQPLDARPPCPCCGAAAAARRPTPRLAPNAAHHNPGLIRDLQRSTANRRFARKRRNRMPATRAAAAPKPSAPAAKKRISHNPPPAHRGFGLPRLSYASRPRNSSGFRSVSSTLQTTPMVASDCRLKF
jgi:hypothetical protein